VTAEAADDFSAGAAASLAGPLADLVARPYVLAIGNTKPHKDLTTLLRALAQMAPARPDLRLLLVGAEPPGYLGAPRAGAPPGAAPAAPPGVPPRVPLGVPPGVPPEVRARVVFTGRVTDTELRTLYAGASAFVFPSRYEGFGLPPLEAMALGVPVVCADAASLPEVVGDAALLFPPGDAAALAAALSRVLDDPALRERLSQAGRERATQFTWQRTAAATVAAYREALCP